MWKWEEGWRKGNWWEGEEDGKGTERRPGWELGGAGALRKGRWQR